MAQKPPAFQFYAKDWLTSPTISSMTASQTGLAFNLMCHCWLFEPQGCLPSDPNKIAKIATVHHGTIKRFLERFPFFFEPVEGLLAGTSPHSRHFPAESSPNLRRFLAVFAPKWRENGGLLGNAKLLVQSVSYWEISEKRAHAAKLSHAHGEHLHEQIGGSAFAVAPAPPKSTTTPLPPASAGDEQVFVWGRETVAVQMGRRRRLPNLQAYSGGRAKDVVEFLGRRGFRARIVSVQ